MRIYKLKKTYMTLFTEQCELPKKILLEILFASLDWSLIYYKHLRFCLYKKAVWAERQLQWSAVKCKLCLMTFLILIMDMCNVSHPNSLDNPFAVFVVPAVRWKVLWFPHAHSPLCSYFNQRIGQHRISW